MTIASNHITGMLVREDEDKIGWSHMLVQSNGARFSLESLATFSSLVIMKKPGETFVGTFTVSFT
jgi:hypothetical protein